VTLPEELATGAAVAETPPTVSANAPFGTTVSNDIIE